MSHVIDVILPLFGLFVDQIRSDTSAESTFLINNKLIYRKDLQSCAYVEGGLNFLPHEAAGNLAASGATAHSVIIFEVDENFEQ